MPSIFSFFRRKSTRNADITGKENKSQHIESSRDTTEEENKVSRFLFCTPFVHLNLSIYLSMVVRKPFPLPIQSAHHAVPTQDLIKYAYFSDPLNVVLVSLSSLLSILLVSRYMSPPANLVVCLSGPVCILQVDSCMPRLHLWKSPSVLHHSCSSTL